MTRAHIVVIGAVGSQGTQAIDYLAELAPAFRVTAVDRDLPSKTAGNLPASGIEFAQIDVLDEKEKLIELLKEADVVANFAGPFYRLGPAVLSCALAANTHYIDICDDTDACEKLFGFHDTAQSRQITAITGAGAAPGMTNILTRMAVEYLQRECEGVVVGDQDVVLADICWCAPPRDITPGIFDHLYHCFETAISDVEEFPTWEQLQARVVSFPERLGNIELVRLGHPEPYMLKRALGVEASLYGGFTDAGLTRAVWGLCREVHRGSIGSLEEAWGRLEKLPAFINQGEMEYSGMVIDVRRGEQGIRFESETTISMEQSTVVPAVAVALMLLEGNISGPGVWSPEVIDPAIFFQTATRISPGGGGLKAYATLAGHAQHPVSLRSLLMPAPVE